MPEARLLEVSKSGGKRAVAVEIGSSAITGLTSDHEIVSSDDSSKTARETSFLRAAPRRRRARAGAAHRVEMPSDAAAASVSGSSG